VISVTAAISPYRSVRDQVRGWIEHFVEIYVATPIEECEARDVKGLYARARAGEIPEFTGVSDPYEAPLAPEITLETSGRTPEESAAAVVAWLEARALI
jgi:adenylylsulfate kinase